MGLPLERWARQAVDLEKIGDYSPVASIKVHDDVETLKHLHRQTWARREIELRESGVPMNMPEGTYGGLLSYPNAATITTTSINGTANLWPGAVFASFPPNMYLTPQAYRIAVAAKITTSTSPGNIGFDPRIGASTWTTGGTAISGTTLGASTNVALTASITNAFYVIVGDMTVRTAGVPGANWTAVGMFHFVSTQATSAGLAGPAIVGAGMNLLFGGTNASFDGSIAQGFQIGAVHTVATITHNVEQIHVMDWN